MKKLPIVWQRLVDHDGRTCTRCTRTGEALRTAVDMLDAALGPLGIRIDFVAEALDRREFAADPSRSNRILVGGVPIEERLGATVTSSHCDDVCRGAACRGLELDSETFEAIPVELVLRAALLAAAELVGPDVTQRGGARGADCCGG